jgi:hypothetical protein
MSEAEEPSAADAEELTADLRSALKGGASEEAPPDVLAGFQKKLRERSGGKFYEDGWSTSRHPPKATYLITSLMMLAVLGIIYALLAPLSGEPVPVENTPQPIQVISPRQ